MQVNLTKTATKIRQYKWPLLAGLAGLFLWLNRKVVQEMPGAIAAFIDAWLPYPLSVTSREGSRSAASTINVIRQFQVASNPRYTPRNGVTFCNIFVWDFTRAMGCEIPHWVGPLGLPVPVGKGSELSANATVQWIATTGPSQGWQRVTELTARARAAQGYPTVVLWPNVGGIGHVAVVYPAGYAATMIAQAGATNFENGALSKGFGSRKEPLLQFWTHE